MPAVTALATAAGQVFAASSSDEGGSGFGLVFLLSGLAFYLVIYFRYRNVDKRHRHENETESTLVNLIEQDVFVTSTKGLTNSEISGANSANVHGAQRKFF
jgi:cbb3-type cytochrome oxidase subunit 3